MSEDNVSRYKGNTGSAEISRLRKTNEILPKNCWFGHISDPFHSTKINELGISFIVLSKHAEHIVAYERIEYTTGNTGSKISLTGIPEEVIVKILKATNTDYAVLIADPDIEDMQLIDSAGKRTENNIVLGLAKSEAKQALATLLALAQAKDRETARLN